MTKLINSSDIVKTAGHVTETPYKYNGGYNYTEEQKSPKYTITSDYLALTLTGYLFHSTDEAPSRLALGDVELELLGGTTHYTYRYKVRFKGQDFGYLMTVPRAGSALAAQRPDYNELRVENHILYRENWAADLCAAINLMGLEFYHITRLDIALDGYGWLDIFERYQRQEIRALGRASMTTHTTKNGSGFHSIDGVDWGKRSSEKHLTAYKVGQRVEIENKGYRAKFWEANGLTDTANVQRLELKLKAKALKRLKTAQGKPITELKTLLSELENPAFLAGVMRAHFKSWFEWVIPDENQKNTSRLKRVQVIDWNVLEALEIKKIPSTKKPNKVWAAKRCATALLEYNERQFLSEYLSGYLRGIGVSVPSSSLSDVSRNLAYAVAQQYEVGGWLQRRDPRMIA